MAYDPRMVKYDCTKCLRNAEPLMTPSGKYIRASYCPECRQIMTQLSCVEP